MSAPGAVRVNQLMARWDAARVVLAELDAAEHPDVINGYGRTWQWVNEVGGTGRVRGRYVHDWVFSAEDAGMVACWGLPSARLALNPNYAGLCDVCRSGWGQS